MADHPLFPVSVVTPEGPAFEGEAEMLIVPGDAGEIGVLARHAPLVAMLRAGSTRVHVGDGEGKEFATGPGFFQVLEKLAIGLVDGAVAAGDIDEARARRQLEEAQEELAKVDAGDSTADRWQLEQRIKHAENQLEGCRGEAPPGGTRDPRGPESGVSAPRRAVLLFDRWTKARSRAPARGGARSDP